jgi:hypothetical protein
MDFDLRELSEDAWRRTRPAQIVFAFLLVSFVGFDLWFLSDALNATHTLSDWTLLAIVDSICTAMATLFVIAVLKTRRPPASLSIDSGGIWLKWTSGRVEHLPWSSLSRGVEFLDYSSNPLVVRYVPQFRWELRRTLKEPVALSKEAYEAVLAQGSANGLRATTRHVRGSYFGHAECESTRLLPPSSTPP